jgi:hypothetical protein
MEIEESESRISWANRDGGAPILVEFAPHGRVEGRSFFCFEADN